MYPFLFWFGSAVIVYFWGILKQKEIYAWILDRNYHIDLYIKYIIPFVVKTAGRTISVDASFYIHRFVYAFV